MPEYVRIDLSQGIFITKRIHQKNVIFVITDIF